VTAGGYRPRMSTESRERLVRLVRRSDADLAEAALLCCVEADPELDVDAVLLRIDALADVLRTRGGLTGPPEASAQRLASYLAGDLRFTGDIDTYHDPDNALLHRVLDTRRGLPITLSILYVAIARRLGLAAFAVNLPGHVVAAIAGDERPVVVDPFHDGILLDEQALADRVRTVTGGRIEFRRSMLRPAPAVDVVRRLLNNLTRDLSAAAHPGGALWSVELKLLLPNRAPDDHRVHGELLTAIGRFDAAADAFERYLEMADPDAPDREPIRRAAIQARARLN
jgi:regulator of sirC expression with transglutaminase-like and TPR domain